jgi:hypothetical protein
MWPPPSARVVPGRAKSWMGALDLRLRTPFRVRVNQGQSRRVKAKNFFSRSPTRAPVSDRGYGEA